MTMAQKESTYMKAGTHEGDETAYGFGRSDNGRISMANERHGRWATETSDHDEGRDGKVESECCCRIRMTKKRLRTIVCLWFYKYERRI